MRGKIEAYWETHMCDMKTDGMKVLKDRWTRQTMPGGGRSQSWVGFTVFLDTAVASDQAPGGASPFLNPTCPRSASVCAKAGKETISTRSE
jgi:hypothetical protein